MWVVFLFITEIAKISRNGAHIIVSALGWSESYFRSPAIVNEHRSKVQGKVQAQKFQLCIDVLIVGCLGLRVGGLCVRHSVPTVPHGGCSESASVAMVTRNWSQPPKTT